MSALDIVDRPAVHATYYKNRPIVAVVLHDSESHTDITTGQSLGGWHFTVERDGRIFSDCSLDWAAWGVAAFGASPSFNRNRPDWLVPCPDGIVSDVNYCTVQIEWVSDQGWRDAGIPYTDAQYEQGEALLRYLESLLGRLPHMPHGWLQTDRTDPVLMDFSRLGLGPFVAHQGYYLTTPLPQDTDMASIVTAAQRQMLDLLAARQITTPQDVQNLITWGDGTAEQIDALRQEVASRTQDHDTDQAQIGQLTEQVRQLTDTVTTLQARALRRVTALIYDDGSQQALP